MLKKTAMSKLLPLLTLLISQHVFAQNDSALKKNVNIDTVQIFALGKRPTNKIPISIEIFKIIQHLKTPGVQLMDQLAKLPSISVISLGNAINKPVIRGLSFNNIQLFANGTRIDNQSWDDRHDIGIADVGYENIEIIKGPSALIYGPNTLGGAIIFEQKAPRLSDKTNGYARVGLFSNSLGSNISTGIQGSKNTFYFKADASVAMHANYVQGGREEESNLQTSKEELPLAGNSKFNNLALKSVVGLDKGKSNHQLTYSLYNQNIGIIEDESVKNTNLGIPEERDYEMEAPCQQVTTHLLSVQNNFKIGRNNLKTTIGYQINQRKEFEPDSLPKSKILGIGLNLNTVSGDIQFQTDNIKSTGFNIGVQGFFQNNQNKGNLILVPDAHTSTLGMFVLGHTDYRKWNFLYGIRIDHHQLKMYTTIPKITEMDTSSISIFAPKQQLEKIYNPYSYSVGFVYHPNKDWSMKINGANGYAAPNYAQLTAFGKHEGSYRFEVGDNNLKMQKNFEIDGSIEYNDASIDASIGGYINSINNYIYIKPESDSVENLRLCKWVQKYKA